MATTLYEGMTPRQANEALSGFVAECAPALQRLRTAPAARGVAPATLLDGTFDSVVPVWEWIAGRCAELGVARETLEQYPTRDSWPSWARHGKLVDPHPPARTLELLNGFVSYLAEVIVASVHRYGPTALVVDVPDWDELRLRLWMRPCGSSGTSPAEHPSRPLLPRPLPGRDRLDGQGRARSSQKVSCSSSWRSSPSSGPS